MQIVTGEDHCRMLQGPSDLPPPGSCAEYNFLISSRAGQGCLAGRGDHHDRDRLRDQGPPVSHQRRRRALHARDRRVREVHRSRQARHGDPDVTRRRQRPPAAALQRPTGPVHVQELPGRRFQRAARRARREGQRLVRRGRRSGDPRLAAQPAQPAEGPRRRGSQGVRQEVPRDAGAARQPRRPPHGDGLAGHRGGGELRHAPRHRGGVRRRLRRPLREPHRAEPLPRHRVGLQLREPAVHAAVHLVRRSRSRARSSSKTS